MSHRTLCADLPALPPVDSVLLRGWVHRRSELGVGFLILRDRSGLPQVVVCDPATRETLSAVPEETTVEVRGTPVASGAAPGGVEVVAVDLVPLTGPRRDTARGDLAAAAHREPPDAAGPRVRHLAPPDAARRVGSTAATWSPSRATRGVELVTGGQRLHTPSAYAAALAGRGIDPAPCEGYLRTFAHGMLPHGGFAIGLERLVGAANVREVTLFPRALHRLCREAPTPRRSPSRSARRGRAA